MTLPDLSAVKVMSLDGETFDPGLKTLGPGFLTRGSYPIGFSYHTDTLECDYIPIAHDEGNSMEPWFSWLKALLARTDLTVVMANARYDLEWLWHLGINPACTIVDIQTVDALINENQGSYSLDSIAKRRGLGGKLDLPIGVKIDDLRPVPPSVLSPYAKRDAFLTYSIYQQQLLDIKAQELEEVVALENELGKVLFKMRVNGVRVDIKEAESLNQELTLQGAEELKNLIALTSDVQPWSSASIATWLRAQGITHFPKTDKGSDSITNEWLLGQNSLECQLLANYRKQEKFRRDFVEGVILATNHKGRLHPSWFSTRGSSYQRDGDSNGTRSGRIACVMPNLTQVPSRNPILGPLIRKLFLPEDGDKWCKMDVSSQEPRIGLHYCVALGLEGAEDMRQQYLKDVRFDYHQRVTAMVNNLGTIPITRNQGKTINLGLWYGLGKDSLAYKLGLSRYDTERLLEGYHREVPFVKQLTTICAKRAENIGFVKTILGRRRHFDEWENGEFGQYGGKIVSSREEAEKLWNKIKRYGAYKAANSVIQGTAAEQTKKAIVNLSREGVYPLIQVYDELSVSASDKVTAIKVKEALENSIKFHIPMLATGFIAKDWSGTDKEEI